MAAAKDSHIADYVLGQDNSKAGEIARDLYKKEFTLVQVIESLGDFLLNPNVELRRRGTQLLADILQKLPSDFLVEKEVNHVATFLLSKLSDHHSVQPFALHGLAAITTFAAFQDGSICCQICSQIFKEVQNQSLSQTDRRATYTIFLNLLTSYLPDVQHMGDNFVCGYIQQMDGEKDPRNLILAFHCSRLICQNCSLGAMEEEMFEVNACYFPVDFVPPPSDPHGITRDDLSEALCRVMAATPAFAQYCYPLLLEKLTSDVASAKLDSLKTLCACLPVYETRHLQEYVGSLSAQIVREVKAGTSDKLVAASLQALSSIAAQLSQVPLQLGEFMAECGSSLVQQVESENPANQLSGLRALCAMASANALVCHAVASRAVPAVCSVFPKMSQLDQHIFFFTEVIFLLQHIADSQRSDIDWLFLQSWRGKLQELCDNLLSSKDPQLQVLGMRGLCALSMWGSIFSATEIASTVEKMIQKALMAEEDSLREESKKVVSSIIQKEVKLSGSVISYFSSILKDNLSHYKKGSSQQIFDNSALLLSSVAVDNTTGDQVCQILIELLQSYHTGHEECLVHLANSLSCVLAAGHLSHNFLIADIFPKIFYFLWPGCQSWPTDKKKIHSLVLTSLVGGLQSVILLCASQTSQELVYKLCALMSRGNNASGDTADGFPLKVSSPWQQSRLVQLWLAAIPCLEDDIVSNELLQQLPDFALQSGDIYTQEQACHCVASLINRMPAESGLDNKVRELYNSLTPIIYSQSTELATAALTLLIWLTKALVVRNHKLADELTCQLTKLLSNSNLGLKVAEGFRIIMTPYSDVLNKHVKANVVPTFQQRFLVQNLKHLLSGFRDALPVVKENYLLAVAGMLANVPQQVLVAELPQLMPLLASSLKGSSAELHVQALTALRAGLQQTPDLLTTYLSDILPDCLNLATAGSQMRVRILALQCVGEMTHLPPTAVQPHQSCVINALKTAIDDRKRLVRKEAVSSRNAWYLL